MKIWKKILNNYHKKCIEETKLLLKNQGCIYRTNKNKLLITYQAKLKVKAQKAQKLI